MQLAKEIRDVLGSQWVDYAWASPGEDFRNIVSEEHLATMRKILDEEASQEKSGVSVAEFGDVDVDPMPTPPSDAERELA